jgi:hypothetical protein
MNLVTNLTQYDVNCVYFSEPKINTIMKNSNFIKIYYSTSKFILNGIYVNIPLMCKQCNDNNTNKYIYELNLLENLEIIEKIKNLEFEILTRVGILHKNLECKLYEKLMTGQIKIFANEYKKQYENVTIKISGVWENNCSYGLNFKICA